MKQPKLFTKVKCVAYMKKIKDGVHIVMYEPDGTETEGKDMKSYSGRVVAVKYDEKRGENVEIKDLSDFCGDSVKKVYRERCEEIFKGVGVKQDMEKAIYWFAKTALTGMRLPRRRRALCTITELL